jgi:hypothetical protein
MDMIRLWGDDGLNTGETVGGVQYNAELFLYGYGMLGAASMMGDKINMR